MDLNSSRALSGCALVEPVHVLQPAVRCRCANVSAGAGSPSLASIRWFWRRVIHGRSASRTRRLGDAENHAPRKPSRTPPLGSAHRSPSRVSVASIPAAAVERYSISEWLRRPAPRVFGLLSGRRQRHTSGLCIPPLMSETARAPVREDDHFFGGS